MKIAHIASSNHLLTDFYGGTEAIVLALASQQIKEGHEVYIFSAPCGTANFPASRVISFNSVPSRRIWPLFWFLDRMTGARHLYKSYKGIDSSFDIVHNHLSEEGIALSFLSKLPNVTTLHGIAHTQFPQHQVTRIFSTTRKTKLVAISHSAYMGFRKIYGEDLIGYVHHGLDLNRFPFTSTPRKQHNLQLCSFGRIAPEKGVVEVIKIADALHQKGLDIELKILGKYDPRNNSYFRNVLFLASTRNYIDLRLNSTWEERARLVGNSDAFLFPVQCDEPFGLAMVESMAYGTPVISLARGSAKEIIEHNTNGFLCENIEAMVEAVKLVPNIARGDCRKSVENNYTLASMSSKYQKMYTKAINI